MTLIPFTIGPGVYNLFVVLDEENLSRMREYDPAQIVFPRLPMEWQAMKLNTLIMGFGSEDDIAKARGLIAAGESQAALDYLARGFKMREGDNDDAYGPRPVDEAH